MRDDRDRLVRGQTKYDFESILDRRAHVRREAVGCRFGKEGLQDRPAMDRCADVLGELIGVRVGEAVESCSVRALPRLQHHLS